MAPQSPTRKATPQRPLQPPGTGGRKVLVTGGAGFIGSHLCDRLLAQGEEVFCLDDFSTGFLQNVRHLLQHPGFTLIEHDVTRPLRLQVDQIYNLACPASPRHYQADPVRTTRTTVLGALNMLELARELGVPILQSSTSEIYGDPLVHPQHEGYWGHVNPVGPRSCYDEGKRCAESLFFDYHRQYGVPIRVCRIFNVYGPRMAPDDGRVVSSLLVQALQGKPLTVFGSGRQTRSFCYVQDMVEGLIRFMNNRDGFIGPLNLGNPEEFTILDLARTVVELTGSCSAVEHLPLPEDDPRQRKPDIGLAKRVLGWQPRISLREGLDKTAAYFREILTVSDRQVWPAAFPDGTSPLQRRALPE